MFASFEIQMFETKWQNSRKNCINFLFSFSHFAIDQQRNNFFFHAQISSKLAAFYGQYIDCIEKFEICSQKYCTDFDIVCFIFSEITQIKKYPTFCFRVFRARFFAAQFYCFEFRIQKDNTMTRLIINNRDEKMRASRKRSEKWARNLLVVVYLVVFGFFLFAV